MGHAGPTPDTLPAELTRRVQTSLVNSPLAAALLMACVLSLSGCVEIPVASRAADELAGAAKYPPGAYPIASTFGDSHDSRGIRRRIAHSGLDIRAPQGTPVVAAAAGRVRVVEDPGAGTVILLHTEDTRVPMVVEFAHLQRVVVQSGERVVRGQAIARVGRSGRDSGGVAHLHFAVAPDGLEVVDPAPLLIGESGILCASDATRVSARAPQLLYPVACVAN
jgi:murein DD-endopeptidase MepM/ murein hydrolase activator NlpD